MSEETPKNNNIQVTNKVEEMIDKLHQVRKSLQSINRITGFSMNSKDTVNIIASSGNSQSEPRVTIKVTSTYFF